jgi:hypothetical protein
MVILSRVAEGIKSPIAEGIKSRIAEGIKFFNSLLEI